MDLYLYLLLNLVEVLDLLVEIYIVHCTIVSTVIRLYYNIFGTLVWYTASLDLLHVDLLDLVLVARSRSSILAS